ncbi:hypothetical protein [Thermodesulfovibrio yellowstonii]|uniref:Uncharacterized protein n=1 Tax=Thermodesulfovibrio yellowstonii (strain ATCC 51303 / DSM 11347 / YP87) TaxID=289376 RepID=B5YIJ2_THEYD|nr:hypothetical protein [Thermodesulfovibrio yellowstonii]ACI20537.1 hypothetical protein THEYE_A0303 [Thermodesulfovibrio yellowstonii DSM 11347]
MRTVAIVLVLVVGLAGVVFAEPPAEKNAVEYVCTVCYNSLQKTPCETLISDTLEGVQQMIISTAEEKQGVDRVIVECSFPQCTKKGYTGYKAVIDMKK